MANPERFLVRILSLAETSMVLRKMEDLELKRKYKEHIIIITRDMAVPVSSKSY